MADDIEKLKKVKAILDDDSFRDGFLQKVLSAETKALDEHDLLVYQIIKASFDAGLQQGQTKYTARISDSGRMAHMANADEQAKKLIPIIEEIKKNGAVSFYDIARDLNHQNIRTKSGHEWYASTVRLLIERINRIKKGSKTIIESDEHFDRFAPMITQMRDENLTYSAIAEALNNSGHKAKNGGEWHPNTVRLTVERIDKINHRTSDIERS